MQNSRELGLVVELRDGSGAVGTSAMAIFAAESVGMTSPVSAASAAWVPTSRPACSLSSHRTSSRSQYAWIAVPALFSASCARCSVGTHHFHHPQPGGGRLVDVMARLPAQLRLIGAQVAEQDAGLPLADVQAGELLQTLRVVTPITNGDTDSAVGSGRR